MSSLIAVYNKITEGINGLSNLWFGLRVAMGYVSGVEIQTKFGYSLSLGGIHDVWGGADLQAELVPPPATGVEMQIRSTDAADVGIEIEYLYVTPDGDEVTDTVTLNGTTPVDLGVGNIRFIQRAYNSNGTDFVGRVLIEDLGVAGAGNYYASILAEDQQTVQCVYLVPKSKVAYIINYSTAINKSGGTDVSCVFKLRIKKEGKVDRTRIRYGLQRGGTSNLTSDLITPVPIQPLSYVRVSVDPSALVEVSSEFTMLLIKEELIPASVRATY